MGKNEKPEPTEEIQVPGVERPTWEQIREYLKELLNLEEEEPSDEP